MAEQDEDTSEIPPTSGMLPVCVAMLQPRFLSPDTIEILGQFFTGGCPMYGRMFSLIPGLAPLDVTSPP